MSVLEVENAELEQMLSQHLNTTISISELEIEKGTEDLGGWNGKKSLVRIRDNRSRDHRLILKQVTPEFAREADIYNLLKQLDAPVAPMLGHSDQSDGKRTLVLEYLPISIDWPIPTSYHLKWSESAAKMASLQMPEDTSLKYLEWVPRLEEYLSDIDTTIRMDDPILQKAFDQYGLLDLPDLSTRLLPHLLYEADQLPRAFNHGEPYNPHTGQQRADGEVLFFDVAGGAIGPRFMDLVAVIIDHGDPYERSVEMVAQRFLDTYNRETGDTLEWSEFWPEVETCRALVAIQRLRVTTEWVPQALEKEGHHKSKLWDGPRKWIILHLQALSDHYLKLE